MCTFHKPVCFISPLKYQSSLGSFTQRSSCFLLFVFLLPLSQLKDLLHPKTCSLSSPMSWLLIVTRVSATLVQWQLFTQNLISTCSASFMRPVLLCFLQWKSKKKVPPQPSTSNYCHTVQNGGLLCWHSTVSNGEKGQGRSWFAPIQFPDGTLPVHMSSSGCNSCLGTPMAPPCPRLLQADLLYCNFGKLLPVWLS